MIKEILEEILIIVVAWIITFIGGITLGIICSTIIWVIANIIDKIL